MAEQTAEQIQREILTVELETKKLQLDEAKQRNAQFKLSEDMRHKHNARRQGELRQIAAKDEALTNLCRHKSGGTPANIYKGGGKFAYSLLTRAIMPDAHHVLIQCSRCPLKIMGRKRTSAELREMKKNHPTEYEKHLRWEKLYEISVEEGIEHGETRGPTFIFQDANGVNFIPQLV